MLKKVLFICALLQPFSGYAQDEFKPDYDMSAYLDDDLYMSVDEVPHQTSGTQESHYGVDPMNLNVQDDLYLDDGDEDYSEDLSYQPEISDACFQLLESSSGADIDCTEVNAPISDEEVAAFQEGLIDMGMDDDSGELSQEIYEGDIPTSITLEFGSDGDPFSEFYGKVVCIKGWHCFEGDKAYKLLSCDSRNNWCKISSGLAAHIDNVIFPDLLEK